MTDQKMREEFEAWAGGFPVFADLERGNHGFYVNQRTHELYCGWVSAWQASRAALVIELPSDTCIRLHSYSPYEVKDLCAKAVEAAGVRVQS